MLAHRQQVLSQGSCRSTHAAHAISSRRRVRSSYAHRAQPQDKDLASEFSSFLLRTGQATEPAPVTPSPLLPPHSVVTAQMEALHRNDYPDADAGLRTAYRFSKPYGAESFVIGQVPNSFARVRSWHAHEEWLTPEEFASMLSSSPYSPMVGCESWKLASPVVFPSERNQNRAVQVVHVTAQPTLYPPQAPLQGPEKPSTSAGSGASDAQSGSGSGSDLPDVSGQGGVELVGGLPAGQSRGQSNSRSSSSSSRSSDHPKVSGTKTHTFTFCLERVDEGALKGIWYTSGVRVGDYSV